jgi:hypothetical protein
MVAGDVWAMEVEVGYHLAWAWVQGAVAWG